MSEKDTEKKDNFFKTWFGVLLGFCIVATILTITLGRDQELKDFLVRIISIYFVFILGSIMLFLSRLTPESFGLGKFYPLLLLSIVVLIALLSLKGDIPVTNVTFVIGVIVGTLAGMTELVIRHYYDPMKKDIEKIEKKLRELSDLYKDLINKPISAEKPDK